VLQRERGERRGSEADEAEQDAPICCHRGEIDKEREGVDGEKSTENGGTAENERTTQCTRQGNQTAGIGGKDGAEEKSNEGESGEEGKERSREERKKREEKMRKDARTDARTDERRGEGKGRGE
jgi:hypothetical protein